MVVVRELDEGLVASLAAEPREPERRRFMAIAALEICIRGGAAAATADVVHYLIEGQAQMVPAFKILADVQIRPGKVKALSETTVVLCSDFVQTLLHAIRGKGIALRVREIHVENYSDLQALQEVEPLMLWSFRAVLQAIAR